MNKKPAPLSRHQAEKALQSLGAAGVPGEISRTRLSLMATQLDEEGLAPLDRLLELLYPGMDEDQAMEAFRKWRSEINRQLKEQGIDFSVHIDDRRKKPRKARKCWLESAGLVEDPMDVYARRMAERPAAKNPVQSLGEPLGERRYCWLYSADNAAAAEKLIDEMETRFRVARQQDFKRLCNGIAVDDRLREGDRDNLKKADLVICLVDHALLAKPGMDDVLEHAGLFPVALESLTGPLPESLKERQLFLLDEKPFPHNKGARQTEFCNALHKAMADYLEKHPPQRANPFDLHERQVVDHLCRDGMVPTRGRLEHIEYLQREKEGKDQERTGEGVPAVDYLVDWALDSQAPVFCALLGEYGIGKTTTCLMLTRALVERRQQEPDLPRVIYLDLREIGGLAREKAPELEDIVTTILKNSWLSPEQPPTAAQVIREVRERRALVIFDGLDEVLVHLDEQQGRRFTRELWRVLPPAVYDDEDRQAKVGKVLISCRTHYFRTIDEGRAHFRAEDRDDIRGRDYRALVILPFTREQIRAYLKANLPQRDPDDVIAMFEQIHNLSELAERPFTLSLIGEQIEALESRRLSGKKVNGASLYQGVVDQWLQRDNGKHQLEPRHKVLLMTHLAADLWRHGDRSRHIDQLEDWFMAFIDSHREVSIHYRQALPVVLKEDLRAATFLVHDGEDRFRFAHRSLHEFFLARHLLHALLHGDDAWAEAWELPPVSRETLGFLGQLLELENEAGQRRALGRLAELHRTFHPRASELAFHYALSALAHGHPRASLRGLQLPGVNLKGMRIAGGGERLDLSGASFTGANLREAEFYRVNLSAADFSDACLDRALLRQSVLREAVFRHASLAAVRFERSDLRDAGWKEAKFYRSRFIFCDGLPPELKSDPAGRIQRVDESRGRLEGHSCLLYPIAGHDGLVWSCAWSPSGDRVVSGGIEGSVRVWDVASGEEVLHLKGHVGWVRCCAWSLSGNRVVSGGDDGNVRVWDVASGEELLCLQGHEGVVLSCAWSPSGDRVVSAGHDGSVRVWDVASGEELLCLKGHESGVLSCAWLASGDRVVSGGFDGSVRVWDVASGEELSCLKGHEGEVWSCAWSPSGDRMVSGGFDGSVRVWDMARGEELLHLKGHEDGVLSCAWSPSGDRVVSGGFDGSVRVWDMASGEELLCLKGHEGGVLSCAWSLSGEWMVSGGIEGSVRVWDVASGEELLCLQRDDAGVLSCAWSLSGEWMVSGDIEGSVRVWDVASGEELLHLKGHEGGVLSCTWSPSGDRVVSGGRYGSVRVWDVARGEELLRLKGHEGGVLSCAWSPSGDRVVSVGNDGSVRVWDVASGEELLRLKGHEGGVWSCAWSPSGDRVVSGGKDGSVRVWDVACGEELLRLKGHEGGVRSCAWSPIGERLISGGNDNSVRVWDVASGEELLCLKGHGGVVWSCAWSPSGGRVVSAGDDGSVRVWDVACGEELLRLKGHEGWVLSCAWSPSGDRVVSAGNDGSVRVWDASSGEMLLLLLAGLPGGNYAALEPDGRCLRAHGGEELWRYLAWRRPPQEGETMPMVYPLEQFRLDCDGG